VLIASTLASAAGSSLAGCIVTKPDRCISVMAVKAQARIFASAGGLWAFQKACLVHHRRPARSRNDVVHHRPDCCVLCSLGWVLLVPDLGIDLKSHRGGLVVTRVARSY
jgi:hypothetical protein